MQQIRIKIESSDGHDITDVALQSSCDGGPHWDLVVLDPEGYVDYYLAEVRFEDGTPVIGVTGAQPLQLAITPVEE